MALPINAQFRYWGIAALVFFVLLWFLGDVLLPFIVGGAIAYFLDPVADRLERLGLSRVAATTVISLIALLAVVLLVLAVIPTLVNQLTALVNAAPDIAKRLPALITLRVLRGIGSLRERRVVREIDESFRKACERGNSTFRLRLLRLRPRR